MRRSSEWALEILRLTPDKDFVAFSWAVIKQLAMKETLYIL